MGKSPIPFKLFLYKKELRSYEKRYIEKEFLDKQ